MKTNAIEHLIQDALLARVGSNPRGYGVQAKEELAALRERAEKAEAENAELNAEVERLKELFDEVVSGGIRLQHVWDGKKMSWWAKRTEIGFGDYLGPFNTRLEAAQAAKEKA